MSCLPQGVTVYR